MTPIPVGTLCLLVAPNDAAGRTCTVTGPEGIEWCYSPGQDIRDGKYERVYEVAAPWLVRPPAPAIGWCAPRRELVPLAPPGEPVAVTRDTLEPREATA